ncbi:hypothetical protein F2P47_13385 [Parvibaculum sedimenti]|uniref:Uncharacterized protein n=1 Tax=Parvibaculum sedimenti TaxID=2608632 RepID=A0A6N6VEY0_9HYPH|nr:hypothetical protein [Parvibaculum sedimenti]KAB7739207.1 hypothetical protein F2P47_13385 [Parvibaculum sedimenti]
MRSFKITFAFLLLLASVAIAGLTYIQSHIAGISTGILLVIVNAAYAFDHRHALFGIEGPDSPERSSVQTVALRHGHIVAMRHDGDS